MTSERKVFPVCSGVKIYYNKLIQQSIKRFPIVLNMLYLYEKEEINMNSVNFKHIRTFRNEAGVPCIRPGIYYNVHITPELYVRLLQVTRKHDIDMAIEVLQEVALFKEMYDVD